MDQKQPTAPNIGQQTDLAKIEAEKQRLDIETQKLKIEQSKLRIEQSKLEIEVQKLKVEKSKLISTSLIGIVPLLAVIGTIFYGIWTQRQQEKTQFQLKAAEIMFDAQDGYEAKARADILKMIFPDKLSHDFSSKYFPDSLGTSNVAEVNSKKELIKLLSGHAKDNKEIIRLWKASFPEDVWVDALVEK